MKKIKLLVNILFFLAPLLIISQESLLDQIEYSDKDYKIGLSTFKANKIINGQSTKQSKKKNSIYMSLTDLGILTKESAPYLD